MFSQQLPISGNFKLNQISFDHKIGSEVVIIDEHLDELVNYIDKCISKKI